MNPTRSDYKSDLKLIDRTLLNLVKGRFFMLIAISVLVLGIVYFVAKKILDFGKSIDYSFLNDTAVEVVVEYLEQYNIYFWWFIVIIVALLALSFLNSLVRQNLNNFAETNVPMPVIRNLMSRLSPMSLEVLAWVWQNRLEPIKINDLKQLSRELRQGRFNRIEEAREQERLLNDGIHGTAYVVETQTPESYEVETVEPKLVTPQEDDIERAEPILRP